MDSLTIRATEMGSSKQKEALVVCSDRSTGVGMSVWDLESGEQLLHIPTCAAAQYGLLCLRNQFLVASQTNRHGSFGGGAVFIWQLNKPQSPIRSYTMESIGPLSCTQDGIYIAGGAPSGNAYLWEVASGRLLRTWHAHHKSLKCIAFSTDDSLLICGYIDGSINVWSMISLLDVEDSGSIPPLLYCSAEHNSSITGLVTMSSGAQSICASSSLDATCKVWDLSSGRLLQTRVYPTPITAITLHPVEKLLFSGSVEGKIFVNVLYLGAAEDLPITIEDQVFVLKGHNESITALTFSGFGLISASEDFTFCIWDPINWVIARRFNHRKGPVTNMVVINQSTLLSTSNNQRGPNQFRVSLLQKYPQPPNSRDGMTPLVSLSGCHDDQTSTNYQENYSPGNLISGTKMEHTTTAIMQMKLEKSRDERMWITGMTKHVMEMNKHLQCRLLDMMQCGLQFPCETDSFDKKKRQKLETESAGLDLVEEKSESAG